MQKSTCLAVSMAGFVLLAYWCYVPLPPGTETSAYYRNVVFRIIAIPGAIVEIFSEKLSFDLNARIAQKMSLSAAHDIRPYPLIEETTFDGMRARVYGKPARAGELYPGVFLIHGGGWCLGNIELDSHFAIEMWKRTDAVFVSIDYRLAPEHVYPAAMVDAQRAFLYFLKNAKRFNVDPSRITIAGMSAGGNMAAAMALWLRDEKITPPVKNQVLLDPVTQGFDFLTPSYRDFETTPIAIYTSFRRAVGHFWLNYLLGNWTIRELDDLLANRHIDTTTWMVYATYVDQKLNPRNDARQRTPTETNKELADKLRDKLTNPYVAPLSAEHLRDLPNAYIVYGDSDCLVDDARLYADRLERDGVKVTRAVYEGYSHGTLFYGIPFLGIVKSQVGMKAFEDLITFMNSNL